ncbi:ATP-binding protein [Candidatus Parvarchaeota archaeon]|nr:ATP-binding protein [Candidatus Parvarchaeota archaeon]
MVSSNGAIDSLYTAKKEIEELVKGNKDNKKLDEIIKSKGIKLEDLLNTEMEIDYDNLSVKTAYLTRDYQNNIVNLMNVIEDIKEFSKSAYRKIRFDIDHNENDGSYYIKAFDEKDENLFYFRLAKGTFDLPDGSKHVFLSAGIYKNFAGNPSFARELFSILNEKVIIKDIEKTYKDLLIQGNDSENSGSLTDMLKGLGLEVYNSDINMKAVGGYNDIKDRIEREVFTPFAHKDILEEIRKLTRITKKNETNSALFYGEPGTGKTLMARVISNENKLNFIYMNISQIYSHWYGDSPKRMEAAFNLVNKYSKQNGKTVLFIDEIDSLGSRQYNGNESNKVLNVLLTKLSGIKSNENENLLLIGCTNLIDNLDPALVSRFKSKIYFRKPDENDRAGIIATYSQKLSESDIKTFAKNTEGLTGRDIESIVSISEENLAYDIANKKRDYRTPKIEDYMHAISLFKQSHEQEKQKTSGLYS